MELDLEARLMGEALILNRSIDLTYGDHIELNDLNEPLELRRNQVEDSGPTIKYGEVIDKPMIEVTKTRNDDEEIEGIDKYPSFCDVDRKIHMDYANNLQFSCMIGKPFCREVYVKAKRFDGMITIYNGPMERMELDLEARLMGEALILNRSIDLTYGDHIELNDLNELNEPLELRRNQVEDSGPTIKYGKVIDKPMIEVTKTRNDDEEIEGIDKYPSFCDVDKKIHMDYANNLQFSCMI
nr:hypothetical protein [Tanacetum cinerariifolium]